jgi:hypothetical protein
MSISLKNVSKQSIILFGQAVAPNGFTQIEERLLGNSAVAMLLRNGTLRQMVDKPKASGAKAPEAPAAPAAPAPEPKAPEATEPPAPSEEPKAAEESQPKKGKGKKS